MAPKDESPRSEGVQYATREEWGRITNSSEWMKQLGLSRYDAQLMCLVMQVKSDAAKNSIV